MKEEKVFTLRIPTDLLAEAHKLAEAQDLSVAQLLRKILKEALAREKSNG